MASLKETVIGIHDAYREASETSEKFPHTELAERIKENLGRSEYAKDAVDVYEKTIGKESSPSSVASDFETLFTDAWSYGNTSVKKIRLDGVTAFRGFAFYNMQGLEEFHFPAARYSGGQAFQSCPALKKVKKEWWPAMREIQYGLFISCQSLASVELPSTATYIAGAAFQSCTALSELKIYNASAVVTLAASSALSTSLIATSTTDGYVYVPYNLADSYKAATNWTLFSSKIRELGYWLFKDGKADRTTYNIVQKAFQGNTEIKTVEQIFFQAGFPSYVDGYAFEGCPNLEEVDLDNILSVGDYSFRNDAKLTEFAAPKLTQIGWAAFQNTGIAKAGPFPDLARMVGLGYYQSASLKEADFGKAETTSFSIPASTFHTTGVERLILRYGGVAALEHANALQGTKIASGEGWVYVPDELVESYRKAPNWTQYASRIRGLSQL